MSTETLAFYTTVNLSTGLATGNSLSEYSYYLSDLSDGANDGQTAIGENVLILDSGSQYFQGFSAGYEVLATTASGVVIDYNGNQILLSTVSYVVNTPLNGLNTTDPYAYCFLGGTMIATPSGEVPVEYLKIGDLVVTDDGRQVPVKWLGEQRLKTSMFTPSSLMPVCIAKGALGNGLPHTDLFVSADHGLMLDGYVVNASALVNGSTIRFVPMAEMGQEFTYYHIETEAHDAVLANGAHAETFIDPAGRKGFDNYAEYLDLYGADALIPAMDRTRVSSARMLPDSVKARLAPATDWDTALDDPNMSVTADRGAA